MIEPSFIRALSFRLAGRPDRHLFSDAFITADRTGENRRLVLISTYYPDVIFRFGDVRITVDGRRLERFTEVGCNEHEPLRAVLYPLDDVPERLVHEVSIDYEGQTLAARLAPERPSSTPKFTLATLFKHDHATLETTYRYYRRQGVERFYFFYNGDFSRLPPGLPTAPDIIYGEWDLRYWLHRYQPPFNALLLDPMAVRNHHHAQVMFLMMVRQRILASCSYLMLVDLDELLSVRGETVRSYVERADEQALSVRCHWTEIRNGRNQLRTTRGQAGGLAAWLTRSGETQLRLASERVERVARQIANRLHLVVPPPAFTLDDLRMLWANPKSEGESRMKTIYRGDFPGLFGIHRPKAPAHTHISDDLKMYHIVNTVHGRYSHITREAVPVSLT